MTTKPDVKYETRSVKAVRGLEPRTRAKLEQEGWEFVSQEKGTVRTEMTFRRPKPAVPWKMIGIGGGVFALIVVVALIFSAFEDGDDPNAGAEALSPSSPSQSATTEPSAPSDEPATPAPVATDITVDELLDKLNSAEMGGIQVGDRFRLTGELVMSELWMTGVSGEYSVLLKAHGGEQDLSVFVDESEAAGWQDGTEIQMVVEMGEMTIDGETTDGWLRALSADEI